MSQRFINKPKSRVIVLIILEIMTSNSFSKNPKPLKSKKKHLLPFFITDIAWTQQTDLQGGRG